MTTLTEPSMASASDTIGGAEPTSSTSTKTLTSTAPVFVPSYVNPAPLSKLRVKAQPFVPAAASKSNFLAEELGLDQLPAALTKPADLVSIGLQNQLLAHINKSGTEVAKAQHDSRRACSVTTKRAATRRAYVPSKRAKHSVDTVVKVNPALLTGVPLQRSGVSNLFDDMDLKSIATQ